ncbi:MAG: GspE/PulE family protein [Patescibacteria group bacterium]
MLKIPEKKIKDILIKEGLITEENFNKVTEEANRLGQDINEVLISKGIVAIDYFYNVLAQYFNVELANLTRRQINENVLKILAERIAREKRAIIFDKEADGVLDVAMEDPSDLATIEFLEKNLSAKIKPFLATPLDLDRGFVLYGRFFAEDFKKNIEENIQASFRQKAGSIEEAAAAVPIVAIIDNLLSYSLSLRSSDIHIEIFEDEILVRFRIDGVLHEIVKIPKEVHPPIAARIKLLSGLKIDEHQRPQDGRFRHKIGAEMVDVRVSVIPTFYGEKVEMRLLTATQKPLSLRELGMMEETEKIVLDNIRKTFGMVLVTGPTGSGKTTTLYSVLNILNKSEVNIVTIEDPVEYDMKYINQTQINNLAGITFANGLRSILRQDPNIIMVGEIRDEETAEIAVHSALTGHLLLSTLHTNDASTAVPRLMDMRIAPFLVAAVLNMVLAQRLVRKICLNCIESFQPTNEMIEYIKRQAKDLRLVSDFKAPTILFRGKGCMSCGNTGYAGRLGIYEVLNIDEATRRIIVSPNFSLDDLMAVARKNGMITMFEDGLRKAALGLTTIEDVLRVIRE